jgi:hypothetical protein
VIPLLPLDPFHRLPALSRDQLSWFSLHGNYWRRISRLNAAERLKAVPLIEGNVPRTCRFQVGQDLLIITRVHNVTQLG